MNNYSRWHLNPFGDRVNRCSALHCPIPTEHFDDATEARAFLETHPRLPPRGRSIGELLSLHLPGYSTSTPDAPAQRSAAATFSCPRGHSWEQPVKRFTANPRCLECYWESNSLAAMPWGGEFSRELNNGEDPHFISIFSYDKYSFTCSLGHVFNQAPFHRFYYGWSCPYCSKKALLPGFNDLESTHPEMMAEWDFTRNTTSPREITSGSKTPTWWLCGRGHSWRARPTDRVNKAKSGCPTCAGSGMEEEFAREVQLLMPGEKLTLRCRSIITPWELDIFLPSTRRALEFNGEYYHSDAVIGEKYGVSARDYHGRKVERCLEVEVELAFVWEDDYLKGRERVVREAVAFLLSGERRPYMGRLSSHRDE